jgi:hypothetical protein
LGSARRRQNCQREQSPNDTDCGFQLSATSDSARMPCSLPPCGACLPSS